MPLKVGRKIEGTLQISLKEAADQYCSQDIVPVKEVLDRVAEYPLDKEQMRLTLIEQIGEIHQYETGI
ncbi:hypothetical protein ACFTAO_43570 [Paenibacillus rhizoplanae]